LSPSHTHSAAQRSGAEDVKLGILELLTFNYFLGVHA
jgi:hypothetical protein